MAKKSTAPSARADIHATPTDPVDRLKALAQRYPKAAESLEFALEIGIIAAQAMRQLAIGVREGSQEVARRHATTKPPKAVKAVKAAKARKRRTTAAAKGH